MQTLEKAPEENDGRWEGGEQATAWGKIGASVRGGASQRQRGRCSDGFGMNELRRSMTLMTDLLHVALFLATLLLVHNVAQTAQSLAEQICALHRGTRSQARARSQHVRSHRAGNEQARHGHAGWAGIPAPRARAMSRPRAKSRS